MGKFHGTPHENCTSDSSHPPVPSTVDTSRFKMPRKSYNEKEKDDAVFQICLRCISMTAEKWEPKGIKPSADRMREEIRRHSALLPLFMLDRTSGVGQDVSNGWRGMMC